MPLEPLLVAGILLIWDGRIRVELVFLDLPVLDGRIGKTLHRLISGRRSLGVMTRCIVAGQIQPVRLGSAADHEISLGLGKTFGDQRIAFRIYRGHTFLF